MPNPIFVAITGGSGSGKTLVADTTVEEFCKELKAVSISLDRFYKHRPEVPKELRDKFNFDVPDSIDFALFDSIMRDLKAGKKVQLPRYSFEDHLRLEGTDELDPTQYDLLVFESILVYSDESTRTYFDVASYVDTEEFRCFIRRQKRDVEERGRTWDSVSTQYLETVHDSFKAHTLPVKDLPGMIVIKNDEYVNVKQHEKIDRHLIEPLFDAIRAKLGLRVVREHQFANDVAPPARLSVITSMTPTTTPEAGNRLLAVSDEKRASGYRAGGSA